MPEQTPDLVRILATLSRQKLAEVPPSPGLAQQAQMVLAPPGAPPPGMDPAMAGMPPGAVPVDASGQPLPPAGAMPPPPAGAVPPPAPGGMAPAPLPPGMDPALAGMDPALAGMPPGAPPPVDANGQPLPPGMDPSMQDPLQLPLGQLPAGLVLQLLTQAFQEAVGKKGGDSKQSQQLNDLNARLASIENNVAALTGVASPAQGLDAMQAAQAAGAGPAANGLPPPPQKTASGTPLTVGERALQGQRPAMQMRIKRLLAQHRIS